MFDDNPNNFAFYFGDFKCYNTGNKPHYVTIVACKRSRTEQISYFNEHLPELDTPDGSRTARMTTRDLSPTGAIPRRTGQRSRPTILCRHFRARLGWTSDAAELLLSGSVAEIEDELPLNPLEGGTTQRAKPSTKAPTPAQTSAIGTAEMNCDTKAKAYKFVAYSALTFSLDAVLSVFVMFPLMYNFVSHIRQRSTRTWSYVRVPVVQRRQAYASLLRDGIPRCPQGPPGPPGELGPVGEFGADVL
uniref:Uncharacterized protein n=1 Tax=Globodera rostochiensis TaxID=31243 RepID=A0A914HKX2_GLORO